MAFSSYSTSATPSSTTRLRREARSTFWRRSTPPTAGLRMCSCCTRCPSAPARRGCAPGSPWRTGETLAALNRVRLNGTACTPLPLLAAATALWSDDRHVEAMRERLRGPQGRGRPAARRVPRVLPAALRLLPLARRRRRGRVDATPLARLRPQGAPRRIPHAGRWGRRQRRAGLRQDRSRPRPRHHPRRAHALGPCAGRCSPVGKRGERRLARRLSPSGGSRLKLARHHFSCRASARFPGEEHDEEVGIGRRAAWRPFAVTCTPARRSMPSSSAASSSAASTRACRASRPPTARATGPASTSTSARRSPPPCSATPTRSSACRSTRSQRFTALQSGEIDILSRNTTWTLTRDASLGLHFTGVTYYDGQGFMVPKKSQDHERQAAEGRDRLRAVGHHHREEPHRLLASANNLDMKPVVFEKQEATNKAPTSPAAARPTPPTPRAWRRCATRKRATPKTT